MAKHELTQEDRSKGGKARAAKYIELREEARELAIERLCGMNAKALDRLERILEAEDDGDAFRAVRDVLDRILGRAAQPLTGRDGGPITVAEQVPDALERFKARIEELAERRAAREGN